MEKIKAILRNKWFGFIFWSLLYILWFVIWTGNLWLLLGKNIGQSDKDEAWTCIRLDSIGETCRNNDKSCCQRNKSIEYGDAYRLSGKASGFVQITSEDQHGTNTNG